MTVKIITDIQAADFVQTKSTLMIGGFLGCGSPDLILEQLSIRPVNNLTVIANDTAFIDRAIGKLIDNEQISTLYVSHIGTNPKTGEQMNNGKVTVNLIPQGTLAEKIRCAGFGLGGFLTPTGVGTIVQEGKQIIKIEDKEYLLELPLLADIALIKAYKADKMGNLVYRASARNFNPLMASAAKIVIAEIEQLVEVGEIEPEHVVTPGIFVDYLVVDER